MTFIKTIGFVLSLLLVATTAGAQESYRIKPGDTVAIEVLEDPSLNRAAVVLPDGRFSFPYAGTIQGAGQTVSELQQSVSNAISSNFATPPNVFVSVKPGERQARTGGSGSRAKRTINIYFLGEVNTPGLREVKPGTTFLQALSQHGGFTKFAATKRIQLRRTNRKTGDQSMFKIDYKALSNGASLQSDFRLQEGDVILVPERRLFE